jgi:molecular chaperone GrpE (heat shock protein)
MHNAENPTLAKWPFFLADALLLGSAYLVVRLGVVPLDLWRAAVIVVAVGLGGYLSLLPFLKEYESASRLTEADKLQTVAGQLKNLESLTGQITTATSRWQSVQEASEKIARQSKEMADRMTAEARAFGEFMKNANDTEKNNLRLEVDKLRRAEGDWLQVVVHTLDHVFALHQSGLRSGQPNLIENLGNFQNACRDTSRRVGLGVFGAEASEPFDPKRHQLVDGDPAKAVGQPIVATLAPGYTLQGRMIRPALVQLQKNEVPDPSVEAIPAS